MGNIPGIKNMIWYDKESMANIFSFAKMSDHYPISYNNRKDDTFYVRGKTKTARFPRSKIGLYFHKFDSGYMEHVKERNGTRLFDTVKENAEGFSSRQLERARKAWKLYHKIGTPGVESFKSLVKGNMIKNCPVTVDDIKIVEKVWGTDVSYLKGKTVGRTPREIVEETIDEFLVAFSSR